MIYYAHSKNQAGSYHLLEKHLQSVAVLAEKFISDQKLKPLARYAGILHDIGKIHPKFQKKLIDQTTDYIDHKGLGFGFAKKNASEMLQYIIAGHHGGLSNPENINAWWQEILTRGDVNRIVKDALKLLKNFPQFNEELNKLSKTVPAQNDLAIRMVFSALVDADFLDTEYHFNPSNSDIRFSSKLDENLWYQFQDYHKKISKDKTGKLNQSRQQIFHACLEGAKNKTGFFRLTVPTGGGKTLSSLGFALKHALQHGKQRIIYAIPFTSIIEQTARIFKSIFSGQVVLEHHTGIHSKESVEYNEKELWNRLASENWDAPIIVTTTVQLFESLLARSTSKCRKLHNIQNSVIIIDEVQTLPMELLPTIMDVLKELVRSFQVTVLFCTATQPALDEFLSESAIKPAELAPNPPALFRQLKRVRYHNYSQEKWKWEKVVQEMTKAKRSMAVVNTKKDAFTLWKTFQDDSVYHLSSAMCGAHRNDILDEIRHKLKNRETCYLVSTQVVEAGVDVDFDRVLRAIGPLDRIVQAGGRCNREGRLNYGEVIIFNPEKGSFPTGIYGTALHKAGQLLNNPDVNLDFNDPATFPAYFRSVRENITERTDIEDYRSQLKFKTIAEKFKMIDDDTVPVVVRYKSKDVQHLLDRLQYKPMLSGETIRELQPFMVNLHRWEIRKCSSLIREIFPGLYLWEGRYHNRLGLLKEIDLANYII